MEGDERSRATRAAADHISIHALRVEGDCKLAAFLNKMLEISIHALRVEGDLAQMFAVGFIKDRFLSTPSGWRATHFLEFLEHFV